VTGVRQQSYVLGFLLPPLLDTDGKPFRWIPCMEQPLAWDEIAPAAIRRTAALICLQQCPALAACEQRRVKLGPLARGVWAGHIMSGRGDDDMVLVTGSGGRRRRRAASLPPLPDVVALVR
jgi:hypothetical protein